VHSAAREAVRLQHTLSYFLPSVLCSLVVPQSSHLIAQRFKSQRCRMRVVQGTQDEVLACGNAAVVLSDAHWTLCEKDTLLSPRHSTVTLFFAFNFGKNYASDGNRRRGSKISMRWMLDASHLVEASAVRSRSLLPSLRNQPLIFPANSLLRPPHIFPPPTDTTIRRRRVHAFAPTDTQVPRCCCREDQPVSSSSPHTDASH
jgi:hypothetical protein